MYLLSCSKWIWIQTFFNSSCTSLWDGIYFFSTFNLVGNGGSWDVEGWFRSRGVIIYDRKFCNLIL